VLQDYGVEFRAVGAWYKCNHCDNSFNPPSHSHFCRQNHHQFTPDRARLVPVYEYKLNTKILNEIKRHVLVYADLVTAFEDRGLTVLAPHSIMGKSGQPRTFDLVVTTKNRWGNVKTIAIDVINSESDVEQEVVRDFAVKVKDAKPSVSFLVVVPKLKDDARELAENQKLTCVEAPSIKDAVKTLRGLEGIKQLLL
jgi:hypothetical protein